MRRVPVTSLTGIFLLVQPFSPSSSDLSAQGPSDTPPSCAVRVAPDAVDAGLSAVQVSVRVSRDVGTIQSVLASGESGITLASPDLLERIRAGAPEAPAEPASTRPIVMGPQPGQVSLWLNLFQAEPGEHEIILEGEDGLCRGTIRVAG